MKTNKKDNNNDSTNKIIDNNSNYIVDNKVNIYEELRNVLITNDAEYNKYFIMTYYQTIPRYYLLCNDKGVNSCIYNFSVGSGKTAAALFVILNNVELYKKYSFNKQFMPDIISSNNKTTISKNVFIIGSWVTTSAVMNELMKEEFGFVKASEIAEVKRLLYSDILEDRKRGEKLQTYIKNKIEKYINFYGYQAFVNNCFPNLGAKAISQDVKVLIDSYKRGELSLDNNFKEKLKNSIIIIDECQKLYSINGLNSYGFTIMVINKLAKELNIKMVFLSGTLFNTSLSELLPIVNIMGEYDKDTYNDFKTKKGIFDENDCLENIELIKGFTTLAPTKKFKEVANKLLMNRFILYDHNRFKTTVKYVGTLYKVITNHNNKLGYDLKATKIKQNQMSEDLLMLKFPIRERLPVEQQIGNLTVYNKDNTEIKIVLYSCEVKGVQREQYKKFLSSKTQNDSIDLEEKEDENTLSIHDVGLPPTSEFIKNGIVKNRDEYTGKFLEESNIKNYSTIGYNLIQICKQKTLKNEKVVIYHNKLRNFGIYQYMLILQVNGFVKYGESVKNNSICKNCGQPYYLHNEELTERVNKGVCNIFKPIYYYYLVGDMKQSEREDIVGNVFNSAKNLYGDQLAIMFMSDVAYSGVSFLNTNNIILLSKISNISKWRQICARIIRTKSHVMLPKDKQYANIYTMVIHYPKETEKFKTQYTNEHKYYIVRMILNDNIDNYINELEPQTIGYKLFNTPNKIEVSQKEKENLLTIYSNDIKKDINTVINRYVNKEPNKIWRLSTFIKRLKDYKESYTFLNLSKINDDYLTSILSSNPMISIFRYQSDNTKELYIKFISNKTKESSILTSFSYRDINSIPKDEKILYTLFKKLDSTEFLSQKRQLLTDIMRFIGGDYKLLANQNSFWNAIYEIHNEYYENDETEFIYNHTTEHRNRNKIAGFYNNEYIVLKDGTTKLINTSYPQYDGWKDIPYRFRISCLAFTVSSPFYLHVNIAKKQIFQEDSRKISRGITCVSSDFNELYKYFKLDRSKFNNKGDACLKLLQILIDKQAKNMNDRNLYTPFEK